MTALFIVALLAGSLGGDATVDLNGSVRCRFDFYQYLTPGEEPVSKRHEPVLEWSFIDLDKGNKAKFMSGSDVGTLDLVYRHQREFSDGISLVLTQGSGAHLFTLWPDGIAYWTKHNSIMGLRGAQQFRGSCANVPKGGQSLCLWQ